MTETPYPIIYCDENLIVADVSPSIMEDSLLSLRGKSMKKYLSMQDANVLLTYVKRRSVYGDTGVVVDLESIKGAKQAYALVTRLFGHNYIELRLFSGQISMLKDSDVSRMMLSSPGYIPEYAFERDRITVNESRDKLEKFFAAGYLRNLYYSAIDPFRPIHRFDTVDITRRIIVDFCFSLNLGKTKFPLTVDNENSFAHAVIDASNYVNLVSLLMKICAHISKNHEVKTTLSSKEDKVSLLFTTSAKEGKISFVGGFAFHFIADMYPKIASYVWAAKYIAELFGMRCYAELSGRNTISIELFMSPAPFDMEIGVMHPDYKLLEDLCKKAVCLVEELNYSYIPSFENVDDN